MTEQVVIVPVPVRTGSCWPANSRWPGIQPVVLDRLPGPPVEPKANGLVGQVIRQLDMRGLFHLFGGDDGPPKPAYGWMFADLVGFSGVGGQSDVRAAVAAAPIGAPAGTTGPRSRGGHPVGS